MHGYQLACQAPSSGMWSPPPTRTVLALGIDVVELGAQLLKLRQGGVALGLDLVEALALRGITGRGSFSQHAAGAGACRAGGSPHGAPRSPHAPMRPRMRAPCRRWDQGPLT